MNKQPDITLRPTTAADLETLFQFQTDEEGSYLAAFMAPNHTDKAAYLEKHTRFLSDPTINNMTILIGNTIVGSVAKYMMFGNAEITYWIDRNYWGKGIASQALHEFLKIEPARPLFGHTAFDNFGSQKVLENCGFVKIGTDKGFASARNAEIEEFVFRLD